MFFRVVHAAQGSMAIGGGMTELMTSVILRGAVHAMPGLDNDVLRHVIKMPELATLQVVNLQVE